MNTPDRLPFRPLDNSTPTRMGYDIEASQWLSSLKSKQADVSGWSSFGIIGFLVSLAVQIILMIIILVLMFAEWLITPSPEKTKVKDPMSPAPKYTTTTDEQMKNVLD